MLACRKAKKRYYVSWQSRSSSFAEAKARLIDSLSEAELAEVLERATDLQIRVKELRDALVIEA
jgi:hypothetical protein